MNRLNDFSEFWCTWLFQSGWQAALVVVAVAILLRVTRRASAQFRYALLLVALAKFAAPPFLTLPIGLFSQSHSPVASALRVDVLIPSNSGEAGEGLIEIPAVRNAGDSARDDSSASTTAKPGIPARTSHDVVVGPKLNMAMISILLTHAAGVIGAAFYFRRQYQLIQRLVRNSAAADQAVMRLTRATAKELRIKSVPAVLVSNETDAPFASGVLRPVILLPQSVLGLPTDELQIIIGHELIHIARYDLVIGWVETMLSMVWWFHPGMWWLKKKLRQLREDCCDDVLLANGLAAPERYCETLIHAAAHQTVFPHEPIALGFVGHEHPAGRRFRRLMDGSLFRSRRLKTTALLLAVVIGLLVLPGLHPAKAPITEVSLEGWFGWKNLSFDPDQDELAIIEACRQVVNQFRSTYSINDRVVRRFDDPETRDVLESLLERKPNFFYAQHLLGTWYRRKGDPIRGRQLLSAALNNAPIVLTQRYQAGTGGPLENLNIEMMAIECNRVKNHWLDPSLHLEFVDLVTDSHGEIALPVYDTVFRFSSRSYPNNYDTEMASLGHFKSASRIGVLPKITAWKRFSQPRDFTRVAAESALLSEAHGTVLDEITSGSNRFRIGRVARCQADGQFVERTTMNSSEPSPLPRVTNAGYVDHAIIDLASPKPARFEIDRIRVLDSKTKIPLSSFQSGAGVKVFDKTRFHLYSLGDQLPEVVDLALTVRNYEADSFKMIISAKEAGSYQKDGVKFVVEYLGAGEHAGWSSKDGFYEEAKMRDFLSEMIFQIDAPNNQRYSILLVTNDGERIRLHAVSPFVRIPKPLSDIDHFELIPDVTPETIFFEKLTLPPRAIPVRRELPTAEFSLTGQAETASTDLFEPMVLRCVTRPGDLYVGGFSGEFGWGFHEQDAEQQDPESKSTIIIEARCPPGIKVLPTTYSGPNAVELRGTGSFVMSGEWGTVVSSRFAVPLSDHRSLKVRLLLESPK